MDSVLGVVRESRTALATVAIAVVVLVALVWLVLQVISHKARHAIEARSVARKDDELRAEMSKKAEKSLELQSAGAALLESRRQERSSRKTTTAPAPADSAPAAPVPSPETDEIDSLFREVDVYMAYGRVDDAVRLLQKSAGDSPDRVEVKAKLAQVHFETQDSQEFLDVTRLLHQQVRFPEHRELWDRVSEMGRQICPQDVLFGGSEGDESDAEPLDELAARRSLKNNP